MSRKLYSELKKGRSPLTEVYKNSSGSLCSFRKHQELQYALNSFADQSEFAIGMTGAKFPEVFRTPIENGVVAWKAIEDKYIFGFLKYPS